MNFKEKLEIAKENYPLISSQRFTGSGTAEYLNLSHRLITDCPDQPMAINFFNEAFDEWYAENARLLNGDLESPYYPDVDALARAYAKHISINNVVTQIEILSERRTVIRLRGNYSKYLHIGRDGMTYVDRQPVCTNNFLRFCAKEYFAVQDTVSNPTIE